MGHALLKTPGGEELIVLSRDEYDRLIEAAEMLDDIGAYDRAKQALAEGRDERVPSSVVDAIMVGENLVRVWRQHRGLTIAALALSTGLSAAYISQIETGARTGTIETMRQLAQALKLDLDDLT